MSLTQNTSIAERTIAGEAVQSINAGGTVLARIGSTFVDVGFAQITRITRVASTSKEILSFHTSRSVLTRIGSTMKNQGLT
jgi:hypothetical protein